MQLDEYAALDAVALAALVRRRELSAVEITAAAIASFSAARYSPSAWITLARRSRSASAQR